VRSGLLVHYSLMFMLASVSFWTVRAKASCGLLQPVQHRADAGRGVSRVFKAVYLRAARAAGIHVPVRVLADKLTSATAGWC